MDRREKQRKFHQAIIDTLYPPPPKHHQQEDPPTTTTPVFDLNLIKDPEEFDSPSSSSDDKEEEGGPGSNQLTRAQRKRLRKKKLKESASSAPQRRKIVGPLLPAVVNKQIGDDDSFGKDRPQGVRQNAPENLPPDTPLDLEDCNAPKEGKLKRRRMAKKLARGNMRPSQHLDECEKDGDSANECGHSKNMAV